VISHEAAGQSAPCPQYLHTGLMVRRWTLRTWRTHVWGPVRDQRVLLSLRHMRCCPRDIFVRAALVPRLNVAYLSLLPAPSCSRSPQVEGLEKGHTVHCISSAGNGRESIERACDLLTVFASRTAPTAVLLVKREQRASSDESACIGGGKRASRSLRSVAAAVEVGVANTAHPASPCSGAFCFQRRRATPRPFVRRCS